VQSFDQKSQRDYCVFGTRWFVEHTGPKTNLQALFYIVEVESLGNHAMVIPFETIGSRYLHIHDQAEWADYFQTLPLPLDPISIPVIPNVNPTLGMPLLPIHT
jgi:hypothetical protein